MLSLFFVCHEKRVKQALKVSYKFSGVFQIPPEYFSEAFLKAFQALS